MMEKRMNREEKMSNLRCPSTGYCWWDGRRKCYYGVEVAVFCHSRDPLDSLNCPDTYKKYLSQKEAQPKEKKEVKPKHDSV